MKTIIAGSRHLAAYKDQYRVWLVADAVEKSGWRDKITEIVSGGARGIDLAGELYAESVDIPVKRFIPDWSIGKYAGPKRNGEMSLYADALILIWDGKSRGSANMLQQAKDLGLEIYEYIV
jgi:hypothetical protein